MDEEYKEISNLGYAFQSQDYYKLCDCEIEKSVKGIVDYKLSPNTINFIKKRKKELDDLVIRESRNQGNLTGYSFTAKILYPGLLVGMSNPTMNIITINKKGKNELFKTGFTFDYVSGLPHIPGSSIKGILRDAMQKYKEDVEVYIKNDLKTGETILTLINKLFGDSRVEDEVAYTDVYERDIFLDAVIVKGSENNTILKEDYITPHSEFNNPIPIRILALRPGVEMKFYFIIKNEDIGGLKPEKRFDLYKGLLLDLGVGAKTNTGYGNLVEV